jgi:DNA invertase Pin-like site-specific DNA recombinase
MGPAKVQRTHQERLACVYVRQSTPGQVLHNQESTERQYQLRERAIALGWAPTAVEVIDEDQGRTGSTAVHRTGFQRLMSQVSMGEVGVVLMLEASRLARNNSDWYHLIEICGLRCALIADEGTVYDPRDPNDRLLLGVKGTISEAEMFTLRTRLYEGRWNKARKGLLEFDLPTGYVREADGSWELDPDTQVRDRVAYVFDAFRRLGAARAVVRDLAAQHLTLPARMKTKEGHGTLRWNMPTVAAVGHFLTNPAYAGAYVYGRWRATGDRSAATGRATVQRVPLTEWPVCIRDHHPAYVTWEEFMQNRERLRANWGRDDQPGAPREGAALLQGLVFCSACGQKMDVQHYTDPAPTSRRSGTQRHRASYICRRGYMTGDQHACQSVTSRPVDAAVTQAFLDSVSPMGLEVSLRVLDQIDRDRAAQRHQWDLQLEQARYEARLAQRQYDSVDPDNRLVAAELERRWNVKLEQVTRLEQAYAQAEQDAQWTITPEQRAAMSALAQDLPAVWHAATTTDRDRKQLLRCAIESVDLDGVRHPGQIEIQIRWHSATITRVTVARPAPGAGTLRTPAEVLALIQELAPHYPYAEIATRLNDAGHTTAFGRPFAGRHVRYLCKRYGWAQGKKHPRRGEA